MPLKTDYKNFIPSTTTKIHDIKQASDGTVINADVILEDVTNYSQEGDAFGSADINATNAQVNANTNAIALKAPLSSPALTGTPTAPTATTGTDTTQIASTEFVQQELDVHNAESVSDVGGVHGLIMESGNWTPTLSAHLDAPTVTYVVPARGTYDRIGDIIKCSFFLRFTATGGSGTTIIGGLPMAFTTFDESGVISSNSTARTLYGVSGTNYMNLRGGNLNVDISEFNTGEQFDISGSIVYRVV